MIGIMGNHVDTRSRKVKVREYDELARRKRATFKQYLRDVEEDFLEEDFNLSEETEAAKFGVEVGQVYVPADGSKNKLTVKDVDTYADSGDVIVFDEIQQIERRISAFKLAKVRYSLVE
jgi:hypothetical protein